MNWEKEEELYREQFEAKLDHSLNVFKDRLKIPQPDGAESRNLRYKAGQRVLGLDVGRNGLNSYSKGIVAKFQRAVLDTNWLDDICTQMIKLLEAERAITDIGGKNPEHYKNELAIHFACLGDAQSKIENYLSFVNLPMDLAWTLRLPVHGGRSSLEQRLEFLGIPVDINLLVGEVSFINNYDEELTVAGIDFSALSEVKRNSIRKDAFVDNKIHSTDNPEDFNRKFNYIKIPTHTSMEELKKIISGKTLVDFNKANGITDVRAPKLIQEFAAKLFVWNKLQDGVPQSEVVRLLLDKYGIRKSYSELDDFVRTFRK